MKKMIPLLVLALLLVGCGQEKPENPYRLKTQVHIRYYDAEVPELGFTYFYDAQGRVSQTEESDGTIVSYTYDQYGNQIRSETHSPDGNDPVSENVLTLDEKHRPIRSENYQNGVLNAATVYGYDKDGRVIQLDIDRVLPDGNIQSWVTRKYDREGNLLREETRWSSGQSGYTEYQYEKSRLVYSAEYDGEDTLQRYSEYTRDEATRTEINNLYRYDGVSDGKVITTYDEYDNPLTVEYFHGPYSAIGGGDDEVDRMVVYTYERIPEER